jgi:hypothetical protein
MKIHITITLTTKGMAIIGFIIRCLIEAARLY